MLQAHWQCGRCLDKHFSLVWARRLAAPATSRRAHRNMRALLSVLRLASMVVERKHLVGQETKPSKRGRALSARELSELTYRKTVLKNTIRVREMVLNKMFGKRSTTTSAKLRKAFQIRLAAYQINRASGSMQAGRGRRKSFSRASWGRRLLKSTTRGCEVYYKEHYHEQPAEMSIGEKQKRIMRHWSNLSNDEKSVYEARAAAENASRAEAPKRTFAEFSQAMAGGRATKRQKRDMHEVLGNTIRAMDDDPIWSGGAGIAGMNTGLKPEFVLNETQKSAARECNRLFGHDGVPSENPAGTMRREYSCHVGGGGICRASALFERITNVQKNIDNLLRRKKLIQQLPLLVCFHLPDRDPDWFWLCKVFKLPTTDGVPIGVSAKAVVLEEDGGRTASVATAADGNLDFATSAQVCQKVLRHGSNSDVKTLPFECFQCEVPDDARKFKATVKDSVLKAGLDMDNLMQPPPKKTPASFKLAFGRVVDASDLETKPAEPELGEPGTQSDDDSGPEKDREHELEAEELELDASSSEPEELPPVPPPPGEPPGAAEDDHASVGQPPEEPLASDGNAAQHAAVPSRGLRGYILKSPGTAKCICCEGTIFKGSIRFEFQAKLSTAFRDIRKVHIECLGKLPAATLDHDMAMLEKWASEADAVARPILSKAIGIRGGGGSSATASSSIGVG